jgi:hypothetical protein
MDAARLVAEKIVQTADGRIHLLIDAARLRAALGWRKTNYDRMRERIDDLLDARVDLIIPARGITVKGHIIDEAAEADISPPMRRCKPPLAEARSPNDFGLRSGGMWRITWGRVWTTLTCHDLQTRYPLWVVLEMRHGISQAVARHCFTHSNVNHPITGILSRVGAAGRCRDRIRELRSDEVILCKAGIVITDTHVIYTPSASPVPVGASPVPVGASPVPVGASPVPVKPA